MPDTELVLVPDGEAIRARLSQRSWLAIPSLHIYAVDRDEREGATTLPKRRKLAPNQFIRGTESVAT
jgi:hypothetical protein